MSADHFSPSLGIHGEGVVGSLTVVVVGEVLLDDSGPEGNGTKYRRVTTRVIQRPTTTPKHRPISTKHLEMDVVGIRVRASVVAVALHQDSSLVTVSRVSTALTTSAMVAAPVAISTGFPFFAM